MLFGSVRKKLVFAFAAVAASLVCVSGFLIGCNTDGGKKPGETVNPGQEKLSEIVVGDVRVQLLSDTLVRVEQRGSEGFEDRKSYLVTNRADWSEVSYSQTADEGKVKIATKNYDVFVDEEAESVSQAYVADKEGNVLWQYEGKTSSNVYLPSPSDALDCWYFSDSPRIIPSSLGYTATQSADLQGWDFNSDYPDFFIFVPGGSYGTFCQDYTDLTGKSEMVSLQMLGYWDSRWYAYSAETALQQINDYRDRGYSIDVLVIDTDWRASTSGGQGNGGIGYDINTSLFPNMSQFLDDCHKLGVNVMFNDHPEPVKGTNNGLDNAEVNYRNEKLTMLLGLGLDYWWYDRNWSVALNSCDPDISVFAFGMYAYQWITQDYLESITDLGEYTERALIMGNVDGCLHGKWNYASDISAHRYSIQWTGDIGADSSALSQEIYAAVFGGAEVGLPYVSSDIGGHNGTVTNEMYSRWMQYGALSTIMRVHCTHKMYIDQEGRMPWLFGETAEEVTKNYVGMRYRLLPLYYSLARENYDTGLPIMRRTDIAYPQYVESSRNDQYMLGENILIAPMTDTEIKDIVPASWLYHDEGGTLVKGLKGEYFANGGWNGNPSYVKTDANVNFNWGTGGPAGVGTDNFSVKWTGKIRFGEKDAKLKVFADDGIQVSIDGVVVINGLNVYDTLLETAVAYKGGSEHDIEIKYTEASGNAHVYLYYSEEIEGNNGTSRRTVFIPDGNWIDVWSGQRYAGPQTITVKHPLTTSPIFVREGAVFALAQNMQSTSEKDWSKLALDIYPGATATSFVLYEDDTFTQAYKNDLYRKTLITQTYDANSSVFKVNVGAAKGTFKGDKAFTEREWSVRIHARAEWGAIKSIKLNGKPVSAQSIAQDSTKIPFAYDGASPDAKIYTFTFDSDISKENVIEITFTNAYAGETVPDYDRTALNFTLAVDEVGDKLDITAAGTKDWAYFGANALGETARKNVSGESLIGIPVSYDSNWMFSDSVTDVFWTDGDETVPSGSNVRTGIVSQKDFALTLKTAGEKQYYVLHVAGYKCTAKVTVRDRAGNRKTISFGDMGGKFAKRIIIYCDSDKQSELFVTYSMLASTPNGTGSNSNVALTAVYVGEAPVENEFYKPVKVTAKVLSQAEPPATVNLSEEGIIDWAAFSDGGARVNMLGGSGLGSVVFDNGRGFYDYSANISWNNGDSVPVQNGTQNGTCTAGKITVQVEVNENTSSIVLYTGAWNARNIVTVYDRFGNELASSKVFTADDVSKPRAIEIGLSAEESTAVTIVIQELNGHDGGNVSLAAIALKGKNN